MRENLFKVFVNYSQILPIWQILFLFVFASFGIHELFLFLFVQKLAPQIYSYSYLRGKKTIRWSLPFIWNYFLSEKISYLITPLFVEPLLLNLWMIKWFLKRRFLPLSAKKAFAQCQNPVQEPEEGLRSSRTV